MHSPLRADARPCPRPLPRLRRALLAVLLLLAAASPTGADAYDDQSYLAYADRMQLHLDGLWNEQRGFYEPGPGGVDALVNALELLTYSVAAQAGHTGPARDDHRARRIARALVSAPVFVDRRPSNPPPGSQVHVPGWTCSMDSSDAN